MGTRNTAVLFADSVDVSPDSGDPVDITKDYTPEDTIKFIVPDDGSDYITGAPQSATLTPGTDVFVRPLAGIAANTLTDPLTPADVALMKLVDVSPEPMSAEANRELTDGAEIPVNTFTVTKVDSVLLPQNPTNKDWVAIYNPSYINTSKRVLVSGGQLTLSENGVTIPAGTVASGMMLFAFFDGTKWEIPLPTTAVMAFTDADNGAKMREDIIYEFCSTANNNKLILPYEAVGIIQVRLDQQSTHSLTIEQVEITDPEQLRLEDGAPAKSFVLPVEQRGQLTRMETDVVNNVWRIYRPWEIDKLNNNAVGWTPDTNYTADDLVQAIKPGTSNLYLYSRIADGMSGSGVFDAAEELLWTEIGEAKTNVSVLETITLTFRGHLSSVTAAVNVVFVDGTGTDYDMNDWIVVSDSLTSATVGLPVFGTAFSPPVNNSRTITVQYEGGAQRSGLTEVRARLRLGVATTSLTSVSASFYDGGFVSPFVDGVVRDGDQTYTIAPPDGWEFITHAQVKQISEVNYTDLQLGVLNSEGVYFATAPANTNNETEGEKYLIELLTPQTPPDPLTNTWWDDLANVLVIGRYVIPSPPANAISEWDATETEYGNGAGKIKFAVGSDGRIYVAQVAAVPVNTNPTADDTVAWLRAESVNNYGSYRSSATAIHTFGDYAGIQAIRFKVSDANYSTRISLLQELMPTQLTTGGNGWAQVNGGAVDGDGFVSIEKIFELANSRYYRVVISTRANADDATAVDWKVEDQYSYAADVLSNVRSNNRLTVLDFEIMRASAGVSAFTELSDTPAAIGAPGEAVIVNPAGNGHIYAPAPEIGDAVERQVITANRNQTVVFGDLHFMCPSANGSSLQMRRGSSPSMAITQFATFWSTQQGAASEQTPNFTLSTSWRKFRFSTNLNLTQHNNYQTGSFVCNGWHYEISVYVGLSWTSNRFVCTRWRLQGVKGDAGADGVDGVDGTSGSDGRGIVTSHRSDGVTAIGGTTYTLDHIIYEYSDGVFEDKGLLLAPPATIDYFQGNGVEYLIPGEFWDGKQVYGRSFERQLNSGNIVLIANGIVDELLDFNGQLHHSWFGMNIAGDCTDSRYSWKIGFTSPTNKTVSYRSFGSSDAHVSTTVHKFALKYTKQ